ncbi:hypothetical protein MYU51_000979 [Penicillium brevicompactum]
MARRKKLVDAGEGVPPQETPPPKSSRKKASSPSVGPAVEPAGPSPITPKKPKTAKRQLDDSQTSLEETTPTPKKRATPKKVTTPKDPQTMANDRVSRARTQKQVVPNLMLLNALSATEDLLSKTRFTKEDLNNMLESPVLKRVEAHRAAQNKQGTRKAVEGECAICFMEMGAREKIVWCQFGCGNNLHDSCFKKWSKASGGTARCVYCRTPWEGEDPNAQAEAIRNAGIRVGGYVNVAEQFGMMGHRGTLTHQAYHENPKGPDVGTKGDPEAKGL